MKKSVLISAYIPGSMGCLRDYYETHLANALGSDIRFIYHDHYQIGKLQHYIMRASELLRRFDVIIGDYPSRVYARTDNAIYMAHGYGTKLSPGKDEVADPEKIKYYNQMRQNVRHLVTLGDPDKAYYWQYQARAGTPYPTVYPLGLPRNDVLFDAGYIASCRQEIDAQYGTQGKFTILFAPTWRGYNVDAPFSQQDFDALDAQLGELNACMFYRPHYLENMFANINFAHFQNIYDADFSKQSQTSTLQSAADMVLTDYSTVFVDYLALQRPVAFMLFDWERYDDYRGMAYSKDDTVSMPGPRIEKLSDLSDYIRTIRDGQDAYTDLRKQSFDHYIRYQDGDSSARIWALVLDILGLPRPAVLSGLPGKDAGS